MVFASDLVFGSTLFMRCIVSGVLVRNRYIVQMLVWGFYQERGVRGVIEHGSQIVWLLSSLYTSLAFT
jgi:hypothetical protein